MGQPVRQNPMEELDALLRPLLRRGPEAVTPPDARERGAIAAAWLRLADRALPPPRRPSRGYLAAKRVFDIVVSALLLVALSPLLALLGVAIKIESGSPAVFGHERVCRNGRSFLCWKLRSMKPETAKNLLTDLAQWQRYVDADFKIPSLSDPRVTRLGRVLRRYRLDELPQLWNVLKGDLSLVGPRPLVRQELWWYGPFVDELLTVRPGVTGAWQTSHGPAYPARACLELAYVREMSFRRDLSLLVQTVKKIVAQDGIVEDANEPSTERTHDELAATGIGADG